jgi:hypothetical protein
MITICLLNDHLQMIIPVDYYLILNIGLGQTHAKAKKNFYEC